MDHVVTSLYVEVLTPQAPQKEGVSCVLIPQAPQKKGVSCVRFIADFIFAELKIQMTFILNMDWSIVLTAPQ